MAGAGSGATHGARGRDAARRRPRLHDDAHHHSWPAARSGRTRGGGARGAAVARCQRHRTRTDGPAARHDRLMGDVEIMKALLNSLPAPVWARNRDGQLLFVNSAYARAVEAEDPSDAVERELELLDRAARDKLKQASAGGGANSERLPIIIAGQRRIFDVLDAPSGAGSAGMAIDATEVEAMRAELARMVDAHRRVLDQLATGVAIFNVDRK